MTINGLHDSRGFTLVEIVVAICILTIALLSLVSVSVMVIKGNSFSKTMTTATTLAKDKMEELKNTAYRSLANGSDTREAIYTRTWTVIPDPTGTPTPEMVTVEVTVQWNWRGLSRNVIFRSIVSEQ